MDPLDAVNLGDLLQGDLLRRVREQHAKKLMCKSQQPALFRPPAAAQPAQAFPQFAPQQGVRENTSPGAVPAAVPWWEEAMRKAIVRAREEGLSEVRPGIWWCPYCEQEVDFQTLDTHLQTNKHLRAMQHASYTREVLEKAAQGAYPSYIEIRNDQPYCTLCSAYATDEHMTSTRHNKRVWSWNTYTSSAPALTTPTAPWVAAPVAEETSGPLPDDYVLPSPAYGDDPGIYEMRPGGVLFCRVCAKVADESHVTSERHKRYASDQEWLSVNLGRPRYVGHGYPPPPPPANSGGHPPPPPPVGTYANSWATTPPPPPPAMPRGGQQAAAPILALPGGDVTPPPPPPRCASSPPTSTPTPPAQKREPKPKPEWQTAWSVQYDREFFYNATTSESVWQLPKGVDVIWGAF